MTPRATEQAKDYVKRTLASQRKLGYSSQVQDDVYDEAVRDTAKAVAKLLRAQAKRKAA